MGVDVGDVLRAQEVAVNLTSICQLQCLYKTGFIIQSHVFDCAFGTLNTGLLCQATQELTIQGRVEMVSVDL